MVGSKRSHVSSSSSESKLKQRSACEFKKKLAEKRRMDLTNQKKKKKGDSVSKVKDRPIICHLSSSAMDRAQAIQAKLPPHFPSFVKLMKKSCVTGRYWLNIPKLFCDKHLPKEDGIIILLDENDRVYYTNYSLEKNGLSVGWKSFSDAHKLVEEDVLVFQLIEPCKFKIYIAKAKRLTEADGATTTLPNQDHFQHHQIEAAKTEPEEENTDTVTETTRDKSLEGLIPIRKLDKRSSEKYSLVSFKDVKGFKDFSIYVNGIVINSEIPTNCRENYYELCKSQNMYLHENLVRGLNGKLVAEMILETIRIADAVRAVDFRTGVDRMEDWDKTLKAFEELGMVVGFMRVRIKKLIGVFREYGADIELKRIERDEAEEEMRALNVKLSRVENRIEKIDAEIDALSVKNEGLAPVLKGISCAPW